MTAVQWIAVAVGCATSWLLGYWLGHRETVRQLKQEIYRAFHPRQLPRAKRAPIPGPTRSRGLPRRASVKEAHNGNE